MISLHIMLPTRNHVQMYRIDVYVYVHTNNYNTNDQEEVRRRGTRE
jgi:hypothetical protein